jgi:ribosomal protein L34
MTPRSHGFVSEMKARSHGFVSEMKPRSHGICIWNGNQEAMDLYQK